nr:MAG TPA: hypothetical protein [Caudoviricetes sp.]
MPYTAPPLSCAAFFVKERKEVFSMCACGKGKRRHRDLLKPQSQGQLA